MERGGAGCAHDQGRGVRYDRGRSGSRGRDPLPAIYKIKTVGEDLRRNQLHMEQHAPGTSESVGNRSRAFGQVDI